MLINKKLMVKGYEENSFHGYVITETTDNLKWNWTLLDEDRKLSFLGLEFCALVDRLIYAEETYLDLFFDSLDIVINTINKYLLAGKAITIEIKYSPSVSALDIERLTVFEELYELNRQNVQLRELLEENSKADYKNLISLSQNFFHRFIKIKDLLAKARFDGTEYCESVQKLADSILKNSKFFDYLALRHFYAAFKESQYSPISAICICSEFLNTVYNILRFYVVMEDSTEIDASKGTFLNREYYLLSLCNFGRDFCILSFDDESNPIHPDLLEMVKVFEA